MASAKQLKEAILKALRDEVIAKREAVLAVTPSNKPPKGVATIPVPPESIQQRHGIDLRLADKITPEGTAVRLGTRRAEDIPEGSAYGSWTDLPVTEEFPVPLGTVELPTNLSGGPGPENVSRFGMGDITNPLDETFRSKADIEGVTRRSRTYDPVEAHSLGSKGSFVYGDPEVVVPGIEPRMKEFLRAAEDPDFPLLKWAQILDRPEKVMIDDIPTVLRGLPNEELEKVAEELYRRDRAARAKEFAPKIIHKVSPEDVASPTSFYRNLPVGTKISEKGRKITSRGNPESYETTADIVQGEVGVSEINEDVVRLADLLPSRPKGEKPIPVKEDPTVLGKPKTVKRVPEGEAEDTLDLTKDFLQGDKKPIDFLGTSTQKEKDRIYKVLESRGIDTSKLDELSPADTKKLEASARRFGTEFDENSFIQDIFTPFNILWKKLQEGGKLPWRQQGSAGSVLKDQRKELADLANEIRSRKTPRDKKDKAMRRMLDIHNENHGTDWTLEDWEAGLLAGRIGGKNRPRQSVDIGRDVEQGGVDDELIEGGFEDISEFGTREVVDPKALPDVIARRLQAFRRRGQPIKKRQLERSVEHRAAIRKAEGLKGPPPNPLSQNQLLNILRQRESGFDPRKMPHRPIGGRMAAPPSPEDLKLIDALKKQTKELEKTQVSKARYRKGSTRSPKRRKK